MKVICALLCLAVVAHAANIQRVSRNTEAIIPSIVEEILKVELKSDLKKNSAVEVDETEPIVKEEIIVEPIASRTVVEEQPTVAEEKTPVIVETIIESIPSVRTAFVDEKVPEIIEKVEIIAIEQVPEKTVDNFRTESVPETPVIAEIIKETVVVEPLPEVRSVPVATEAVIEEEEIVKPMVRNVIKEEIPQVEELRIIPEKDAVKDTIPEPVVSANIVEPVVEIEPQVKTLTIEMEKMMIPEMMAEEMNMKTVPEIIMMMNEDMTKLKALVPEVMEEKKEEPEMVKDEVKAVVTEEEEVKKEEVEGTFEPATKGVDGRQSIIQQLGQSAVNTLSNVPVIGPIVQRITPTTEAAIADAPPADVVEGSEAPLEGEAPLAPVTQADATTRAPNPVQQLIQSVQTGFQNQVQSVQSFLTGGASNTATVSDTSDDTNKPPTFIQQLQQGVQGLVAGVSSNLANFGINVPTTAKPTKTDDKLEDASAEPVAEEGKSVEPQPQAVVEPETVVEKKEETPVEKIEIVETQS